MIERALDAGEEGIAAADAFQLHDTYGFPFDLTRELVAERGLGVDPEGFERLMDAQRERARAAAGGGAGSRRGPARAGAGAGCRRGLSDTFHRLRDREQRTSVGVLARSNGSAAGGEAALGDGGGSPAGGQAGERYLLKLAESPFYAGRRRPGLRRRHDRVRARRLPRARGGRLPPRRRPGARGRGGARAR